MAVSNAALRDKFKAFKRLAWKPRLTDGDGPLTGSKYSGIPLRLPGESWPVCRGCGKPLQLFLQLNIAALPDAAQSLVGRSSGILQFFYCTRDCDISASGWEPLADAHFLRIISEPGSEETALLHDALPEGHFPPKQITGWESFDDYPSLEEAIALPALSDAEEDAYYVSEPFLNSDGDKLGGWPDWVQSEEYPACSQCGTQMHLIYQLGSWDIIPWMWGDAGIGHITQCAQHRDVLAFGWACS